ncbi:MAG: hypothetical protein C4532_13875 [Candidatus Abyssobacteria bacterium SURF_17]|uniref:Uncharacterized protein n=1 Tax=Candidatus Abyssobacteria bacterium SURF_17 TaxID=2093361 RepID=A0A419EUJ5_9BACT|nr:MAG: hypothetical protein C4532_13875 [Candidatus Abyssubacteria bacterium SURF_17]
MRRFRCSGFWILLAIALLDVIVFMVPLTALAIVFCILLYPAGIGFAGRWLCRLYEEMTGEKLPDKGNNSPRI